MRFSTIVAALISIPLAACATEVVDPDDGPWRGTITSKGNVTTVANESGSVWGGTATLVEEASIGVASGPDEYMFGRVSSVAAFADRIYVLDSQIPTVRVYDLAGVHALDIGGPGDGPGEFDRPDDLAIGPDGAAYVRAGFQGRLTIFEPDGELRDTWPIKGGASYGRPTIVTESGGVFLPGIVVDEEGGARRRQGMVPWGPTGPVGQPLLPPEFDVDDYRVTGIANVRLDGGGMRIGGPVPFAPAVAWDLAPSGALFASYTADYNFEIRAPDGKVIEVRKAWDPVAVSAAEAEWHKDQQTAGMRRLIPDWTWNGPEVPATKPAFQRFIPAQDGSVWLSRLGPGSHHPGCDPDASQGSDDSCWDSEVIIDVFGDDGRFLGQVELPEGFRQRPTPFVWDDKVIAVVEDEAGTIMVKRYRLVLPEEE